MPLLIVIESSSFWKSFGKLSIYHLSRYPLIRLSCKNQINSFLPLLESRPTPSIYHLAEWLLCERLVHVFLCKNLQIVCYLGRRMVESSAKKQILPTGRTCLLQILVLIHSPCLVCYIVYIINHLYAFLSAK